MIKLDEDMVNPECDEVYYQTPEELKVKGDSTPDVVHDDSLPANAPAKDFMPPLDEITPKFDTPMVHKDEPVQPQPAPIEAPKLHDDHCDISPMEAIRKCKSNPATVSITKMNGKYYIDHNDLRCYMDACGESNYECALNNIIAAHNEDGLASDNIGIVMGESDLLKLDPETKMAIESSEVNFEVYDC